jgi:hypothetical protein
LVRLLAIVAAIVSAFAPLDLKAQAPTERPTPAPEKPAPSQPGAAPQPAPERPPIPDKTKLNLLIQSYMVALSQANLTGNYSVLHAFGAPSFQENNPPDKLFQTFAEMRSRGVDLTPVIVYTPILLREPVYDEQGLLHLVGYYKTEPQQVHFELTLQPVGGLWRLFEISVKTVPTQPVAGVKPETPATGAAAVKKSTPGKESSTKKNSSMPSRSGD